MSFSGYPSKIGQSKNLSRVLCPRRPTVGRRPSNRRPIPVFPAKHKRKTKTKTQYGRLAHTDPWQLQPT